MAGLALGLIEIVGLPAAIEAADAAVKSANVKLIGYENAKGGGLITIKLQGEVGAVKAAVQAGCAAASKISLVNSSLVIPRPHDELTLMLTSKETIGASKNESGQRTEVENKEEPLHEVKDIQKMQEEKNIKSEVKVSENITCNICNDINCKRKKGEPKNLCIHYNNLKILKEE